MRKSVLAGIFACTLILAGLSAGAEASEITIQITDETTEVVSIEKMNETPKSPLLTMTETEPSVEVVAAELVEEKKPVVHKVAENESLSTIAKQYETTWERVYSKNTQISDPNIVNAGTVLVIPETTEVVEPRQIPKPIVKETVVKKSASSTPSKSAAPVQTGSSVGNGYVAGYCTWYVKNRRPDLPNNLGNASTWVSRASAQGLATGSTPSAGAVGQRGNHVVYVESFNSDGTVTISEMNHKGRYVMTTRTLPANYFTYIY